MEALVGQTIKNYQILKNIDKGGFGEVYVARQTNVDREVIIKKILPQHANQPDFIRRFEQEANLVARLEHLHIVPLYDYWRDQEGAYLVMRYMRGGSLKELLEQTPLSLEACALLVDQIAMALFFAHQNQVIHRDIKPGNLLMDEDGNAFLADFGIAKDLRKPGDGETSKDAVGGTLDYLSPEQARGEPVTGKADIYSLAVVVYEILEGQHPFHEFSRIERLFKHINDPLPDIENLEDPIRDDVNQVIQKATMKDPVKRYVDVLEFATELRNSFNLGHTAISVEATLTAREHEVLQCLVDGLSNSEIAEKLFIEPGTVKWYNTRIYEKLGVKSRVQAAVKARDLQLIGQTVENPGLRPIDFSSSSIPDNPYKGLHAFGTADSRDFFGRDEMVQKLLEKMHHDNNHYRFLSIIGPSGSGKSSLVKAGLIPAIWDGKIPGSENWFVVDMLPGTHPIDTLETSLTRVAGKDTGSLREQLDRDNRGLIRVADIILPKDNSELLIVVDQFEEVFTLVEDETARQHFLDLLYLAVTDERSRVRVILTLRADYYDRPLHYPDFGELIRARMETVLPLTAKGLERAVRGPAERVGVTFDQGLVAQIVADMNYQAGALPLLQYALTELFDRREGRLLTHEAYQEIGGAVGALANRADEIFSSMTDEAQELAHQLFLRLVTLGEGAEDTRRRADFGELLSLTENSDLMEEVIDSFADYRLLSLDNDPETRQPTVEVAHEAILREWDKLRQWLNEARDDIRQQRNLARASEDWDNHKGDASYLLRGSRLREIENWLKHSRLSLTPLENYFIETSLLQRQSEEEEKQAGIAREKAQEERARASEKRSRQVLRALVAVFALATVLSGGLGIFAFNQRNDAIESEQEALIQASIGLAALTEQELDDGNAERAVLIALETLENYPHTAQAQASLIRAVDEYIPVTVLGVTSEDNFGEGFQIAKWSPDGTRLAGAGSASPNTTIIWDLDTADVILSLAPHKEVCGEIPSVKTLEWSPASDQIVTFATSLVEGVRTACGIMIWDSVTGETLLSILPEEHKPYVYSIDWSPDARLILVGKDDGIASIYDTRTGENSLELVGHTATIMDARFSPDAQRIATASADATVRLWDAGTGEELSIFTGHVGAVNALHWSPDGTRLLTAGDDALPRIWDTETGTVLQVLRGHAHPVDIVDWSHHGYFVATISTLGGVEKVWHAESGRLLSEIRGTTHRVGDFSPDDTRIVTSTSRQFGRVSIHDISSIRSGFIGHTYGMEWAGFSSDGTLIATSVQNLLDPAVHVWSSATGELVNTFDDGLYTRFLDWSPEGTRLAVSDTYGPFYIWDVVSDEVVSLSVPEHLAPLSAQWSPDGTKIAGSLYDGDGLRPIYVWDVGTQDLLTIIEADDPCMQWGVEWSPDGTQIVSSCVDFWEPGRNTPARIRDAMTGEEIMSLDSEHGWTSHAVWSPDGSRMLVGYEKGVAVIWDLESGEVLQEFVGHSALIYGADWHPDGIHVLTGDNDGNVRVWNSETGIEVAGFQVPGEAIYALWSPDGSSVIIAASGSTEPVIRQIWLSTEELIEYAYDCCVTRELTDEERIQFGLLKD